MKKKIVLVGSILAITLIGYFSYQSSFKKNFSFFINKNEKKDFNEKYVEVKENNISEVSNYYAISTSHPEASRVGEEVLRKGGNAVDAAIAISYALGVVEPYASGIGGGGGMLIYDPETGYHGANYRDRGVFSRDSVDSSIAIPGFVLGMEKLSENYGTMSVSELIQPSIDLSESGFLVDEVAESYFNIYEDVLIENPDYLDSRGNLIKKGSIMKPKKMMETLKKIQKEGSYAFYQGNISDSIVKNTWLTTEDLEKMTVEFQNPVVSNYKGNEIATLASPFSGVTLIQMLKLAEQYNLSNPSTDSLSYMDNYYDIKSLAYEDRLQNTGDPNYYSIDSQYLVSDDYINELLAKLNNFYANSDDDDESVLTTHFVVMDQNGMMVSVTNTLGTFFGSQVEVEGFYMNAAMNSFAGSGLGINKFEPGKQPRNFTAPTIIRNGGEIVGIGSPGGRMIPEFIFQAVEDHFSHGVSFEETVEKNRFTLYNSKKLIIEDNPRRTDLLARGGLPNIKVEYTLNDSFYGAVNVIEKKEDGSINGVADSRRNGSVIINKMVNK